MDRQKDRNTTPTVSPNAMPLVKITQRWKLNRNTGRCYVYHSTAKKSNYVYILRTIYRPTHAQVPIKKQERYSNILS